MEPIYKIPAIRVTAKEAIEYEDLVATERALALSVNGIYIVSLLCSPDDLEALAIGFLLSEGLLATRQQLQGVKVDAKEGTVDVRLNHLADDWQNAFHHKTLTSGCGKGITFTSSESLRDLPSLRSSLRIRPEAIHSLMSSFRTASAKFQQTGGVHSAALATETGILLLAEDIGRHNAVDKLLGKAFLDSCPLHDKILLSSGRISGEIMTKVVRNRLPVLVSRTAPTCMAVTMAEDFGITLIGFARNRRMNIYTHPQRLLLPDEAGQANQTQLGNFEKTR